MEQGQSLYYDRAGAPITAAEWVDLYGDDSARIIGQALLPGDVLVSTVWIGLNHNHADGPPLIFETLIFGGAHDGQMWRYATETAARTGHDQATAMASSVTEPF